MLETNPLSSPVPFADIALQLNLRDNVAIAKRDIRTGTRILLASAAELPVILTVADFIPAGHKLALQHIDMGQTVLRYGQVIGFATEAIQPGQWVHTHNLGRGEAQREYAYTIVPDSIPTPPHVTRTFEGFLRPDGRAGTRNYIAVISTVNCSAHVVQEIAHHFRGRLASYPNVDGVLAITHGSGCAMPAHGLNLTYLQRTLANLTRNPNIAACVFVGLGCEVNQMQECQCPELPTLSYKPLGEQWPYLVIQELGGTRKTINAGIEQVAALLPVVNAAQRSPVPAYKLTVALQCGGSDSWSGITANPLVGLTADRIVALGGTVVLSETPEIFGGEFLLSGRVSSAEVGEKFIRCFRRWEEQGQRLDFRMDDNPSPGNKAGGLSTIFEKSLGAIAKGGSTPLRAVYDYAELIDTSGLVFMDTGGYDPASVTGQVAGGCNVVLFTTGRGSVFGGSVAPCIKVASNDRLYERMSEDMDFNAGMVLGTVSLESAGEQLLEQLLAVASGVPTKSERTGPHETEFVPWTLGTV